MNKFTDVFNAQAELALAQRNIRWAKNELFTAEYDKFLTDAGYRSLVWRHAVDMNNGADVDIWDNDEDTLTFYFVEYIKHMHYIDLNEQRLDYLGEEE
jgi:hypothetical protein